MVTVVALMITVWLVGLLVTAGLTLAPVLRRRARKDLT